MPTAADRLAQQHQRDIATIAGGVTSVVASVALGADPAAIGTWYWGVVDGLINRVQVGYAQSRRSAMGYLPRHAALSDAGSLELAPGSLDVGRLRERLRIVGPVGFKSSIAVGADTDQALRSMATRMAGVADETVRDGDRDVVEQTALRGRGVVGWRRRLSGRACGFCSMLASRGAVYVNKQSATVSSRGTRYHEHCHCWAEPLYKREEEPASVRLLRRQWDRVTAGHSGKDAQRVWRRHWEQRVTPRARQRFGLAAAEPSGGRAAPGVAVQVRQILADAQSPEAVSRVLAAEYSRITGRTMTADLRGSVATAREHAEGVLRAVERSPEIAISAVRTGATRRRASYAETSGTEIVFSDSWSSVARRQEYLEALAADVRHGWHPKGTDSPMAVAVHEAGHVLDPHTLRREIDELLDRAAAQTGVARDRLIQSGVSGYAERDYAELVAEAFSDVVANGAESSGLSRAIVRMVEASPRRGRGGVIIAGEVLPSATDLSRLPITRLQAMVREAGITVPTGLRKPALVKLVDDLDSGVPPATARARAVESIVEERRGIADALTRAVEVQDLSGRAMGSVATALRRELTADQVKTLRPLLEALDAGDGAAVRAAIPAVARSAKLRQIGEAGAVSRLPAGSVEWIGPGRSGVVSVVRPGWETTMERRVVLLQRAAAQAATPEQAARFAPAKAAKKAAKAAPAAPTYDARLTQLRTLADSRVTRVEKPEQGLFGRVEVQVRDGRRVVHKVNTDEDAVRNTDAEELAARVMDAIGARAPAVLRLDDTSMLQEFVDGVSARTLVNDVARRRAFAESDDGRLIGLGDILTANSDQGLNNLIIAADGRIVAVDYGAAFTRGFKLTFNDADEFSRPLLGRTNDLSPDDMAIIRPRLEALRPDFERLGHADWHRAMMARFDRLERAARGTTPRLTRAPAKAAKKATPRASFALAPELKGPTARARHAQREEALQAVARAGDEGLGVSMGATQEALEALQSMGYVRLAPAPRLESVRWTLTDKGRQYIDAGPPPAKATPRKAPAPPAPERMTAPALRKELADRGVTLDVTGVPKPVLAEHVARLRSGSPAAAETARLRQAVIDRQRAAAETLAEAVEILDIGAEALGVRARARLRRIESAITGWPQEAPIRSLLTAMQTGNPATIRRAVATAERRLGLTRVEATTMDRSLMSPVGGTIRDGARVEVVRPGYTVEIGGERVVLSKAVVREQRGRDIGLPSRDVDSLADLMGRAPSDAALRRAAEQMTDAEYQVFVRQGAQALRDGVEGTYAGLRVQVDTALVRPDTVYFTGTIYDATGREVGEFVRSLAVEGRPGRLVAHHTSLELSRRVQGSGFAEDFNANLLDWYRRSGVAEVRLTANVDVGGFAWARKGFDFESVHAANSFLDYAIEKVATAIRRYERSGRLPRGLTRQQLSDLETYIAGLQRGGETARAAEIAAFGRQDGQGGKTAVWPGKWLMLGSSWRGRMRLTG